MRRVEILYFRPVRGPFPHRGGGVLARCRSCLNEAGGRKALKSDPKTRNGDLPAVPTLKSLRFCSLSSILTARMPRSTFLTASETAAKVRLSNCKHFSENNSLVAGKSAVPSASSCRMNIHSGPRTLETGTTRWNSPWSLCRHRISPSFTIVSRGLAHWRHAPGLAAPQSSSQPGHGTAVWQVPFARLSGSSRGQSHPTCR